MTRKIDPAIADKLGKLIPRLATDHDGEVVATAGAIERTLRSAGLDLHDLGGTLGQPQAVPQPLQSEPISTGLLRIGDKLTCRARSGVFRPCSCGSTAFTVSPGAGPHVAQMRCDACGRRGRFLSRGLMVAP
jgi:hypothetical protein